MRATVAWYAGAPGMRVIIPHSGWLTWHLQVAQYHILLCEGFRYRVTVTAFAVTGNGTITVRVGEV